MTHKDPEKKKVLALDIVKRREKESLCGYGVLRPQLVADCFSGIGIPVKRAAKTG